MQADRRWRASLGLHASLTCALNTSDTSPAQPSSAKHTCSLRVWRRGRRGHALRPRLWQRLLLLLLLPTMPCHGLRLLLLLLCRGPLLWALLLRLRRRLEVAALGPLLLRGLVLWCAAALWGLIGIAATLATLILLAAWWLALRG